MKSEKLTNLSELGEFGLIDTLTKDIKYKQKSTIKGIGDDAAVLQGRPKFHSLVSTDLLIEGVHFDLTYTPLKHLGYKAAIVNFSDMAAMNGKPKQIVVGLGISAKYTLEALEELYEGIRMACHLYNVDFVGGDTTSSKAGLFISVTVIGEVEKPQITYRSGASEGDLICVTGDLGGAYIGLLVLEREKRVFQANPNMQPELSGNDYVIQRQLKPEARVDIVDLLKENDILPTSMIDISDGLASETMHLCKNSNLGCMLYEEKIPIDQQTFDLAREFKIVPTVAALNGGEEYELLFTIKQSDYEKIQKLADVTVIGYMTEPENGKRIITGDNLAIDLKAQGWDGLKSRDIDSALNG
jgi:thiamine-monophosphate kinase